MVSSTHRGAENPGNLLKNNRKYVKYSKILFKNAHCWSSWIFLAEISGKKEKRNTRKIYQEIAIDVLTMFKSPLAFRLKLVGFGNRGTFHLTVNSQIVCNLVLSACCQVGSLPNRASFPDSVLLTVSLLRLTYYRADPAEFFSFNSFF